MIITYPGTNIIDAKLKRGDAVIRGTVTESEFDPTYWIIDDLIEQKTLHVLVSDRPDWVSCPVVEAA